MNEEEMYRKVRDYLEELALRTPLPWKPAPNPGYLEDPDILRFGADETDMDYLDEEVASYE